MVGSARSVLRTVHPRRPALRVWYLIVTSLLLVATGRVSRKLNISDTDRDIVCNFNSYPATPPSGIRARWLHIPKTGTSFANSIWHYGCPDLPVDITVANYTRRFELNMNARFPLDDWCPLLADHTPGTHKPIGQYEYIKSKGSFVSMFRDPHSRIMSAFAFGRHCIQDCNPENNNTWPCDVVRDVDRREVCQPLHDAACPADYARTDDAQGCAAKMIMGYPCNAHIRLSDEEVGEAVSRVRKDFSFIGLVEEWNLSVCLFRRQLGGEPLEVEHAHVRSSEQHKISPKCAGRRVASDPADDQVYVAAREIFEAHVHQVVAELLKSGENMVDQRTIDGVEDSALDASHDLAFVIRNTQHTQAAKFIADHRRLRIKDDKWRGARRLLSE